MMDGMQEGLHSGLGRQTPWKSGSEMRSELLDPLKIATHPTNQQSVANARNKGRMAPGLSGLRHFLEVFPAAARRAREPLLEAFAGTESTSPGTQPCRLAAW